jgi:hypothetical protein
MLDVQKGIYRLRRIMYVELKVKFILNFVVSYDHRTNPLLL